MKKRVFLVGWLVVSPLFIAPVTPAAAAGDGGLRLEPGRAGGFVDPVASFSTCARQTAPVGEEGLVSAKSRVATDDIASTEMRRASATNQLQDEPPGRPSAFSALRSEPSVKDPVATLADFRPQPYVTTAPPLWSRSAVIYQINTRQFTREGTFAAAQTHLERLSDLGVDILWLMPIHPIGEKERKGSLGSPYAVQDYRAINPDLGDEADLKAFVSKAHELGMHVILDWVANHSAWDNPLIEQHPEWYLKTPEGEMTPTPGTDWSDIVDFDYSQPGLRKYMTESLLYWVREFGIDGYRADVAGYVPLDFWETARRKLDEVKPVFMLGEWETRDLHRSAFDATYAWSWKDAMQETARDGGAAAIRGYYATQQNTWPEAAFRMVYTSNHDQNAWDGVASEIYGPAYEAAIVLSFVGSGIPLIYNGQEADLSHQLSFFEKDEIRWKEGRYKEFFRTLIDLKHSTRALWNGSYGASMMDVPNNREDVVFSFIRKSEKDRVFAAFNFSDEPVTFTLSKARHVGAYTDVFSDETVTLDGPDSMMLPAWGFRILRSGEIAD